MCQPDKTARALAQSGGDPLLSSANQDRVVRGEVVVIAGSAESRTEKAPGPERINEPFTI